MPRMLRPKAIVLPDSALVPADKQRAPPRRFTHRVLADQPFHFEAPQGDQAADGQLQAGARVKLLQQGEGPLCTVVDEHGVCVVTDFAGLQPLR